jgi:hypothetical protein
MNTKKIEEKMKNAEKRVSSNLNRMNNSNRLTSSLSSVHHYHHPYTAEAQQLRRVQKHDDK